MRYVASALLQGCEKIKVEVEEQGKCKGSPTMDSMAYLRDRVGVPRDLPLPAARQLRAHLNWFMNSIQ